MSPLIRIQKTWFVPSIKVPYHLSCKNYIRESTLSALHNILQSSRGFAWFDNKKEIFHYMSNKECTEFLTARSIFLFSYPAKQWSAPHPLRFFEVFPSCLSHH